MKKIYSILLAILAVFCIKYSYGNPPLKKHKFDISGLLKCINSDSPYGDEVGVKGATIKLYMRWKDNTSLYQQPAGISLDPKDLSVTSNSAGEFAFNLEFLADLSMYDKIVLAIIPGGDPGEIHHYEAGYQYITSTTKGNIKTIGNNYEFSGHNVNAIVLAFDNNKENQTHSNVVIKMEKQFGNLIRTLSYAYEFTNDLYDRLNYSKIGKININILKDYKGGGAFDQSNNTIYIKKNRPNDQKTLAHEYGHFIHNNLNSSHIPTYTKDDIQDEIGVNYSREAFAEFYSKLIREYISDKCGVALIVDSDFEVGPFEENRFLPCNYENSINKLVPRKASYLWNIYDGPTQVHISEAYKNMDNDDVDGGKNDLYKQIFEVIRTCSLADFSNFSVFNQKLKDRYSTPELKNSVQKIYDCMFGTGSIKMRPVQIKSASLGAFSVNNNDVTLTISSAGYYPNLLYANNFEKCKLYGKNGNNWEEIKSWNAGNLVNTYPTKSYTLKASDLEGYSAYRVTSNNSSGNACFPVSVNYEKVNVNLIGSVEVDADKTYIWQSQVTGGTIPYIYEWKVKKSGQQNYLYLDPNKCKSDEFTFMAPNGEDFTLELSVKDKNGVVGYATKNINTTIKPLMVTINGVSKIGANLKGNWTADVSGGLPPYSYSWSKSIEDGPTLIYFGKEKNLETNAGVKPFDLKLTVKDVKDKSLFTSKHVTIDQGVPMTVGLTGDKITYLHKPGHWKVNITGGAVPYNSITFLRRKEGTNTYAVIEYSDDDACEKLFEGEGVYYLKALVKDHDNESQTSEEFKVTAIYQPVYATIEKSFTQHYGGAYYIGAEAGEPAGGKPSYFYQWRIGHTLSDLKIIPGGNDSKLVPYKVGPFPGTYVLELKVSDAMWNSVKIYSYIKVGDPLDIAVGPPPVVTLQPLVDEDINLSNYPNPTSGMVNLGYELKEASMVEIFIIDSKTGARALLLKERQALGRHQLSKNLSYFNNGVYEIQVDVIGNDNKRKTYKSRLVITK